MFDQIETLSTLAATGTMTRTATHLRITQSTVSKRIAALEREVGQPLTEAHGRGVRLTPAGHRLLERAAPLVASLRHALREEEVHHSGRLAIGVSESILAAWGPRILARVRPVVPEVELEINAHRSPVAIERVRARARRRRQRRGPRSPGRSPIGRTDGISLRQPQTLHSAAGTTSQF